MNCALCHREIGNQARAVELHGGFFEPDPEGEEPFFVTDPEVMAPTYLHLPCLLSAL